MFLIVGVASRSRRLDAGEFYCPHCDAREEYDRVEVRPWFTLFFLPIFPVGSAQQAIECRQCRQHFDVEALRYEPPSEAQRMMGQFFAELKTGTSLEVLRQKMINHGLSGAEADRVLEKMCEGHPRTCRCGQHFHPAVARCSNCGAEL